MDVALGISLLELAKSSGATLLKMEARNVHTCFALEWFNVALWFAQDFWESISIGSPDGLLHKAGKRKNIGVIGEPAEWRKHEMLEKSHQEASIKVVGSKWKVWSLHGDAQV